MTENKSLKRKGKYSITEVFEYLNASPRNGQKINFHGDMIHIRVPRMLVFRYHGIKCVRCGMLGAFFAKEQYGENEPHLNLYGFDKYGDEILMNKDHIKPKSKGGINHLYNMLPMCSVCNNNKADSWTYKEKIVYVINIIKHWFLPKS